MPYCPKCDMEFVEGVTVCSDCKGPLADSPETTQDFKSNHDGFRPEGAQAMEAVPGAAYPRQSQLPTIPGAGVYVEKSQRYEDMKSSSSAFFLVGGILLIFSLLSWMRIIILPTSGVSGAMIKAVASATGIVCVCAAAAMYRSSKPLAKQAEEERQKTEEYIAWFVSTCTGENLDTQLAADYGELEEDEKNFKRLDLIQDRLITSCDLPDQAYVDFLCEKIYERLYESDEMTEPSEK